MIRKRTNNQNTENSEKTIKTDKISEINSNHKDFTSYKEEAIYVVNLLKKQGIDIYDENRYGGMYLNHSGNSKFKSIFKDKKENNSEEINKKEISNDELSMFFKK